MIAAAVLLNELYSRSCRPVQANLVFPDGKKRQAVADIVWHLIKWIYEQDIAKVERRAERLVQVVVDTFECTVEDLHKSTNQGRDRRCVQKERWKALAELITALNGTVWATDVVKNKLSSLRK